MIVNSPYRSAMWCGCHGVMPARSAHSGTASSATTSTKNAARARSCGSSSRSSQQTWTSPIPTTYRIAVCRCSGSLCAARAHWPIIATRITT